MEIWGDFEGEVKKDGIAAEEQIGKAVHDSTVHFIYQLLGVDAKKV